MRLSIFAYLLADFVELGSRYADILDFPLLELTQLFCVNDEIRNSLDILGMSWFLEFGLTTID